MANPRYRPAETAIRRIPASRIGNNKMRGETLWGRGSGGVCEISGI